MAARIAINGFGRMGRLATRTAWHWPEIDIVHVNVDFPRLRLSTVASDHEPLVGRFDVTVD